jgi:hypothetical protein
MKVRIRREVDEDVAALGARLVEDASAFDERQ